MHHINELQKQATESIRNAVDLDALETIRIEYLGKKGLLTDLLKGLAGLPAAEKPRLGQVINQAKRDIISLIDEKKIQLQEELLQFKLKFESIDVTLPGRFSRTGSMHPVAYMQLRILDFFGSLGFDVALGPEIETEFYNFEALNIPEYHPARAMHDTFYFGDGTLLRTHTSPVQIRILEHRAPPLRLIAPGRVYRCDSDATHTPMFHQVEGLLIDQQANMASLRSVLQDFFSHLFNCNIELRFRPSYFPFTEPSAEVDIACNNCQAHGCRVCKYTGWLEVLGCGMVHPHVLKSAGISSEAYQGWAFGMGMDRLAMLYFGIDDLRMLFENDLNLLRQF